MSKTDTRQSSILEMFDAVAARNATAVAIQCGERQVSYGELLERANALANYLITHGAENGSIVAILTEDTSERIVGILGSLKAGAAFMPLDVRQPAARLRKLMELAPPHFLLTESEPQIYADQIRVNPRKSAADQVSYIYFTSGSSGTPKAIAGRLKGLSHFIKWEIEELKAEAGVRVSQLLSPSFDGSLRDIFLPLCVGGVVCVPPQREQVLEGRGLVQWLEQERIEIMHCVPSVFRAVVNEDLRADELGALRYVVMAGESLLGRDVAKWKAVYGERVTLLNLYGTSETTMAKFSYRVAPGDEEREVIPIGKPIPGATALVVDEKARPCLPGIIGEIYIRTPYRSLGYYAQPELTAAVFVPNPFSTDPNDLVHKTGDMGRVLEDGNFEYLGRRDEQVKVRGARVELKEVENAVRGQAGVLDVAVIEREDGSGYTYLCAYLVLAEGVQTVAVAEGLELELPDYMLPSAYVEMPVLPRTISGKVDRRALPEVGGAGGAEYVAPRTPVEEMLVASWEKLLGREPVGIDDNFFRMGGHSLLATQVMSRIRRTFHIDVPLRVLFEAPTVKQLALVVTQMQVEQGDTDEMAASISRQEGERRTFPLSFAQQRLWFSDQLEPGNPAYNIPAAFRMTGRLDIAALERAFTEITRRHEILRTRFVMMNGQPVQMISPAEPVNLLVVDLSELVATERNDEVRRWATSEAQHRYDLSSGPLLRVILLRLGEDDHVLLFTMHHIISDGWSMGVVVREVTTLYEAFRKGHPSPLRELTIQYADYAVWQRQWLQGAVLETQLAYWRSRLGSRLAALELPTDRPRPAVRTNRGATQYFTLPAELANALHELSRQHGVTLFITLLAAFQTLLWRYTGQDDIVVGSPISGRNRVETESMIGFFINTMVLRTGFSDDPTFIELLQRVKEVTLGAQAHQDVPFEKLVEELQPERQVNNTPWFQVWFVLENAGMHKASKLPELTISHVGVAGKTAQFDLTLALSESEERIGGGLTYSTDLFDGDTISEMVDRFTSLLEGVTQHPDWRLLEIPLDKNELPNADLEAEQYEDVFSL